MRILLIDNHSKHSEALKLLLAQYGWVTAIDKDNLNAFPALWYDLVVLSWGHDCSVIGHEAYYEQELHFITTAKIPVIGICLGAQLIAHAFAATLKKLPKKLELSLKLDSCSDHFQFSSKDTVVAERHWWCVTQLGTELEWLAKSPYGYEIFKHKKRPIYGLQFHPEIDTLHLGGDELLDLIIRNGLDR